MRMVGGALDGTAIDLTANIDTEFVSIPYCMGNGFRIARFRIVERDHFTGWPTRAEFVESELPEHLRAKQ